jgi:broad specificity phosphatase PhoE
MATTILLIRRGQTEWNHVERSRGRADVPLNNTGLQQAEATGRREAAQWQPAALYSSPLSKAVKTAEMVGRYVDLKPSGRLFLGQDG